WCDVLTPTTAEVLSTYADRHFKRKAAITVNQYGKGKVYYIGCDLDRKVIHEIVEYVSRDAGVRMSEATAGVEIIHREDCTILLNHNATACEIPVKGESAFTGEYFEGPIPGYGVEIIKR
ncbi:MAG: beta-galactosidase trimerization domain-containing protein, partial [Lachnospiraceae bacterium]|nr:beta-galactosidase trimerization domain-containing protein [Lachnospiraceae bacterium]